MPAYDDSPAYPMPRHERPPQPRRRPPTGRVADDPATIAGQFLKVLRTPEPRRFGEPGRYHGLLRQIDGIPNLVDDVAIPPRLQREARTYRERGAPELAEDVIRRYVAAVKRYQQFYRRHRIAELLRRQPGQPVCQGCQP